jgi:hypothetical protein
MPKKRPRKVKRVKNKLWIYCEGSKTEVNYLRSYLQDNFSGGRLIQFVDVQNVKENTPVSLVNRIAKDKESHDRLENDLYWVTYDRESPTKYPGTLHEKALDNARAENINVALSNVCVELWFLLHFEFSTATYNSCDDILTNSNLKTHLCQLGVDKYDKGSPELYHLLKRDNRLNAAITNSKRLNLFTIENNAHGTKLYDLNPYTDFYKILEAIDDFMIINGLEKC